MHYDPGDYVWMETSTLRTPLNTMAPRRHGPYRVIRKVGLNSYELDFGDKSKRHNPINEEKLSPYMNRDSRLPWPANQLPNAAGAGGNAGQLPALPPPPNPGTEAPIQAAQSEQPAVLPAPEHLTPPPTYANKDLIEIQQWREIVIY